MTEIINNLQKQEPGSGYIELFDVSLGNGSYAYFCANVDSSFQSVQFRDRINPATIRTYVALPVEFSGLEATTEGTLNRPRLVVANVLSTFQDTIGISNDELIGKTIYRRRTLAKYLYGESHDSNPPVEYPVQSFFIDRKESENNLSVTFELASPFDLGTITLPRRQIIPNACSWIYQGASRDKPEHTKRGGCSWHSESKLFLKDGTSYKAYFDKDDLPIILEKPQNILIMEDPYLLDSINSFNTQGTTTLVSDEKYRGGKALQTRTNIIANNSSKFTLPVDLDKTYRFEAGFWLEEKPTGPTIVYLGIQCLDGEGNTVGTNLGRIYLASWSVTGITEGDYRGVVRVFGPNGDYEFHPGTVAIRLLMYTGYTATDFSTVAFDHFEITDITHELEASSTASTESLGTATDPITYDNLYDTDNALSPINSLGQSINPKLIPSNFTDQGNGLQDTRDVTDDSAVTFGTDVDGDYFEVTSDRPSLMPKVLLEARQGTTYRTSIKIKRMTSIGTNFYLRFGFRTNIESGLDGTTINRYWIINTPNVVETAVGELTFTGEHAWIRPLVVPNTPTNQAETWRIYEIKLEVVKPEYWQALGSGSPSTLEPSKSNNSYRSVRTYSLYVSGQHYYKYEESNYYNDIVLHNGALWRANITTNTEPDYGSSWTRVDLCGKRLNSCAIRFGYKLTDEGLPSTITENKELPYGGFPASRTFEG